MMNFNMPKWLGKRKAEPKHFVLNGKDYMPNVLDLSDYDSVDFLGVNFSGVREIKWPKKSVYFYSVMNFPSRLDFSTLENVSVVDTDLSGVCEIKCPSKKIEVRRAKCSGVSKLFLSGGKRVALSNFDLLDLGKLKCDAECVVLNRILNVPNILDFGGAKTVMFKGFHFYQTEPDYYCPDDNKVFFISSSQDTLNQTVERNTNINDKEISKIILPSEKVIYVNCAFTDFPELDFSSLKEVYFNGTDFNNVGNTKWPSGKVVLNRTSYHRRAGVSDFSKTKKVIMNDVCGISLKEGTKWPTEYVKIKDVLTDTSVLDFSNTQSADLSVLNCNLKTFNAPKEQLLMEKVRLLPTKLDFSGLKKVSLSDVHLQKIGMPEITWPAEKSDVDVDNHCDFPLYKSYVAYNNELLKRKKEYQSVKSRLYNFVNRGKRR